MYNVLKALGLIIGWAFCQCASTLLGEIRSISSQPDDHYRIINPQPEGWRSRCRHRKRWSTI